VLDLCPAGAGLLRRRSWSRALIEKLEERRLLSATIALSDGVLEIAGDSTQANVISLLVNDDRLVVIVNGTTDSVPVSAVKQIDITGGTGNDLISLARNVEIDARIEAPGGNNFIRGGDGNDIIVTGSGSDYVDARGGADIIIT
jgi:Ca2+-binding RTX toxin-like protein